jgi:S1-C subfamily serine protease
VINTAQSCFRAAVAALFLIATPANLPLGAQDARAQDASEAMQALVRVTASVPEDATTARSLGTEREGNGILIDASGLVLTIGYLIVEAESIEVQTSAGTVEADFVGYDGDTGFGLVRAHSLDVVRPMPLGDSSQVEVGDKLQVGGFGKDAQPVDVISRGEFVGSWEYLLDSAVYTAPAFPDYGGAALIRDGRLVGVGSIYTTFVMPGVGRAGCNMFVPIDLLKPILDELVRSGRSGQPSHPWLGLSTEETEGRVVVTMVTPGGPAEKAGLREGDIILAVARQPVGGMAEFYRRVWSIGPAGVSVSLRVLHGDSIRDISVKSVDRNQRLKHPPGRPGGVPAASTAWLGP